MPGRRQTDTFSSHPNLEVTFPSKGQIQSSVSQNIGLLAEHTAGNNTFNNDLVVVVVVYLRGTD